MNIVFGGSFNPITLAHLKIIKLLKEKFRPDNLIVMPASDNYTWKNLTKFDDRFNMVKLCEDGFIVSDFEAKDKEYKGTFHTLNELSKKYDDLYFCMGADNILKLDQWINYQELLSKFNFIVFTRKGYDIDAIINQKYFEFKNHFHKLELEFDISSSLIRTDVDKYQNFLPSKVYKYIKDNNLYRRMHMFHKNFIKVAAITPRIEVGNPFYNIEEMLKSLKSCKASIAVFPELCVTGYTCQDVFFQNELIYDSNKAILEFIEKNDFEGIVTIGAPFELNGSLYNCAYVIKKHELLGIVPKRSLPNSKEYYEKRWFKTSLNNDLTKVMFNNKEVPFGNIIFKDIDHNLNIGVEICEDMWSSVAPSNIMAQYGANVILNLSASNETLGKSEIRRNAVLENSRRNCGAYVYASAGALESTSDTVYSGHNIIASLGRLVKETENFSVDTEIVYGDIDLGEIIYKRRMNTNLHDDFKLNYNYHIVLFELSESEDYDFEQSLDQTPFVPKENEFAQFDKVANICEYGLYKRMSITKAKTLVIGVSGGLDSTLALLIARQTFDKLKKDPKDIIAITMPGFATSKRTKSNATKLMEALGCTVLEKPINKICQDTFKSIDHDPLNHDVTYENVQARVRTLILMNYANKTNGLVLGTGDMSELALGWCTYNGDQMSMYGINAGIPKTLVRFMIKYYAKTKYTDVANVLEDIIDTPISPELSDQSQSTEDSIGKYEINDFILNRYLANGDDKDRIKFLLNKAFGLNNLETTKAVDNFFRRFFTQQFKRQATPDGPKVLDISLNPRSDYRMPSDVSRR
jgi:NAD+ synthase (glutamine-hydrolysing)